MVRYKDRPKKYGLGQTSIHLRVDNDVMEAMEEIGVFNRNHFINQAIREKIQRERLASKRSQEPSEEKHE